ncbi:MAG: methyltransferase domain-containing protein [Chloroflexi bacterium]|nr:methyltransferase domain-containing protein [Chloroflexota bacterium]
MAENYTRYNVDVDSATAQRLLDLNRQFYTDHGRDFSATRERLQPGVMRVLETLRGSESILDLGCGNGELARTLSRRGQRGSYLGLDFSLPLLNEAKRMPFTFPVKFLATDITAGNWRSKLPPATFNLIFAFAVFHHIPSFDLRLNIIKEIYDLLEPGGLFIHSNWQFLNSERLKARIQAWDKVGLSPQDVDPNDYLLDWKRGGTGLRYVHYVNEEELKQLAKASDFEIIETFYSDGENKKLGLYQVWRK